MKSLEIRSEGYFFERVTEAVTIVDTSPTVDAEFYLVGLLNSFTNTLVPSGPLALTYLDSGSINRTLNLKMVGDTSLFLCGWFPESFRRSITPISYYAGLGRSAYEELSSRARGSSLETVFEELAHDFPQFVRVIRTVRASAESDREASRLAR